MIHFQLDHLMSRNSMITFALIIFSAIAIYNQYKKIPCESTCIEKGYAGYRYLSEGKYGYPKEACYCLTKKETQLKKQIPKGKKIKL